VTEQNSEDAADVPDPDVTEFDVFALRSFKFSIEQQTQKIGQSIGWWSDGRARIWRPVASGRVDGWEDGTCEAVCHGYSNPRHEAPDENCGCGVYGSLSYADVLGQYHDAAKHLVAVIAAEGKTIIGTRGLRTAFARVVAYWADPTSPGLLGPMLDYWGRRVRDDRRDTDQPTYREVAALQFKDAQSYDCPLEMVEEYGLALLPPAESRTGRGGGNYWTGRHQSS
jgi:hypothetical protein